MPTEFESPGALWLLLLTPFLFLMLRRSLVDESRGQLLASAVVRTLVVVLLILALSRTLWLSKTDDVTLLVLADVSASTPDAVHTDLSAAAKEAGDAMPADATAGIAVFSGGTTMAAPIASSIAAPDELPAPNDADRTDIAGALELARQIMPSDTVNRVLLLSDGFETTGDGEAAAKKLRSRGIKVFTRAYAADARDEVLLEDLQVPPEVKRQQTFSITTTAHSTTDTTATFALYRNGFKIDERDIELKAGANPLVFEEPNPPDGMTKYEVRVEPDRDFFADNNVASGIVYVSGEPSVLLLEGDEREGRHLARALAAEGIRVDVRDGRGMPGTLEDLAAFDVTILSDVPATDLNLQQMALLRSYVEDLGGGFVMVGGEESFGLGGYYQTAVEQMLPVRVKSEKRKDTPSLSLMLVMDKSGSMNGEKIDLAREAAIASIELLNPKDYVGVIAFDGAAYWAADLQRASGGHAIIAAVESIEAGGGTSMYPALEEAYAALAQVPSTFKHVVVLTDGHSQPGEFATIVDQMAANSMTVSTVAVGEGADTMLLEDMARWGRGRYYFTADPYDIPQIFTKETMTASRSSLVEEPFLPQVFHPHQVIRSIDWESAPFLFGYVVTAPKPTSEVALVTERGEPLLAMWRYGLGKSVAFTSDAKSRWAADWIGWPGYGTFWAQIIREIMRTSTSAGNETQITLSDDKGHVTIDTTDGSGRFVNGLKTSVQVVDPALEVSSVALEQTAPGRYEGTFPAAQTGSYLLRINQSVESNGPNENGTATVAEYTRGISLSYRPEYRRLGTNEAFLKTIAEVTDGEFNAPASALFEVAPEERVTVRKALWPWLVTAALLLFVVDVALRRLDLSGRLPFSQGERYG